MPKQTVQAEPEPTERIHLLAGLLAAYLTNTYASQWTATLAQALRLATHQARVVDPDALFQDLARHLTT